MKKAFLCIQHEAQPCGWGEWTEEMALALTFLVPGWCQGEDQRGSSPHFFFPFKK